MRARTLSRRAMATLAASVAIQQPAQQPAPPLGPERVVVGVYVTQIYDLDPTRIQPVRLGRPGSTRLLFHFTGDNRTFTARDREVAHRIAEGFCFP